jgi:hypothetical protein
MIAQAAILDAQYLRVERRFRGLFDQIRGKDWTKLPTFEIGLKTAPQSSYWNALGSWSIFHLRRHPPDRHCGSQPSSRAPWCSTLHRPLRRCRKHPSPLARRRVPLPLRQHRRVWAPLPRLLEASARAIEPSIAQHDPGQLRFQHLTLETGDTTRGNSVSAIRTQIERILLAVRQRSGRIDKGNTLGNQTPGAGLDCRRNEIARSVPCKRRASSRVKRMLQSLERASERTWH